MFIVGASAAKPGAWAVIKNVVHRTAEAAKVVGRGIVNLPSKMVDFVKHSIQRVKDKYNGNDRDARYDNTMPPGADYDDFGK